MAPPALVARPALKAFHHAILEQAALYVRVTRTIPVSYRHRMMLIGLFGGGEDNTRA